ncbi:Lrp/AsnC family transcriptional regulator [Desulfoluna spongiiphila]|uniref:Transcriptional regulator, AsnC family n=1 Tax=Desulfoluna spongiiphila TaxID=419481 RepID=A0A1G5G1Q6_9BACT|nr:Lrp/AsnC family transcriptional regulator [Desulfoluna spongiiphila]SCY45475.1 transcriptional regulator, AsnC family [Desulfoluna spongiiphila]VVS91100.1 transcription regulator asnc-type [Desulfoluna spongiiphila]
MKSQLDATDRTLIKQLSIDGRMPVNKLVEHLGVTPPTLYSRMKRMLNSGVLKIAGLIDIFKTEDLIMAIVAFKIVDGTKLEERLEQISKLKQVHSAMVVTGRFDIFIEVVVPEMPALYEFMTKDLPALGDIESCESFVVMKAKNKWVLPKSTNDWFDQV